MTIYWIGTMIALVLCLLFFILCLVCINYSTRYCTDCAHYPNPENWRRPCPLCVDLSRFRERGKIDISKNA